jgi:prevent-host-death family protein
MPDYDAMEIPIFVFWRFGVVALPRRSPLLPFCPMAYPLTAAREHLCELVAEARDAHHPVTISEHGRPVVALISVDDLADLEDRAALAAHFADKAAGRPGVSLDELDSALGTADTAPGALE